MDSILERVSDIGLVPVITSVISIEDADPLGKALTAGGIPVAEVTFRMPGAEAVISAMVQDNPDMIVGAGTVTNITQVDLALAAGAKFIVTPALNEKVVRHCQDKAIPVVPGIATPSELDKALDLELNVVKFFPAEQMGGLATLKAFSGPFKGVKFIPTGGISLENLASYLTFDRVSACGGTFMLGKNLECQNWQAITDLCKQAVSIMLGLELVHVGVNNTNTTEALASANRFAELLRYSAPMVGNSSIFVGTVVELMKTPYLGTNGHIAFKTNLLERAVRYLSAMGVKFNAESEKRDATGKLRAIYLEEEVAGFAIHLL